MLIGRRVLTLAIAVGAGATALGITIPPTADSSPPTPPGATVAARSRLAETKRLFRVFADDNPAKVPTSIRKTIRAPLRPVYAEARQLPNPVSKDRKPWYLIPSRGRFALILTGTPQPGGSASTLAQACNGRLWIAVPRQGFSPIDHATSFYGVATNDITSVVASGGVDGNGSATKPVRVKVKHNAWQIDAPYGARVLTFKRGPVSRVAVSLTGPNPDRPCDADAGKPQSRVN